MSFNERSISFSHMSARPPQGTPAGDSFNYLTENGFNLTLNPMTESQDVQQYIEHELLSSAYVSDAEMSRGEKDYTNWRNVYEGLNLFTLMNRFGQLAVAGYITPREPAPTVLPEVSAKALAGVSVYNADANLVKHFMRVSQGFSIKRYKDFVQDGILMIGTSVPVMRACQEIGYQPITEFTALDAGIGGLDMVVSSGPLEALNVARPKPEQPRTYLKPWLKIIKGGKDNEK